MSCLPFNHKVLVPMCVRWLLLHSLALGVLKYAATLYYRSAKMWHDTMNSLLTNILKGVAYKSPFSSGTALFLYLRLPNFGHLFPQSVVLPYFWWTVTFLTPKYVSCLLRNVPRYKIPCTRTRYGSYIRSYYLPFIVNGLPHQILVARFVVNSKELYYIYIGEFLLFMFPQAICFVFLFAFFSFEIYLHF